MLHAGSAKVCVVGLDIVIQGIGIVAFKSVVQCKADVVKLGIMW